MALPNQSGQTYRFVRKDLLTGTEKPLSELTRCFNRTGGPITLLAPSSDGQWLLWEVTEDRGQCYLAARIDGTRSLRWPSSSEGDMI